MQPDTTAARDHMAVPTGATISVEAAVEGVWQALEWEPLKLAEIFDRFASRLHRNPRFRDMSIGEIDRLLIDARREIERDLSDYEWRLVGAFKDAIGFEDGGAT
jgi:hypothetical protein